MRCGWAPPKDFVAAVTEGQPPPPGYFARVAELNRESHQLAHVEEPPLLPLDQALRLRRAARPCSTSGPPRSSPAGTCAARSTSASTVASPSTPRRSSAATSSSCATPAARATQGCAWPGWAWTPSLGSLHQPESAFVEHPEATGTASRLTARQWPTPAPPSPGWCCWTCAARASGKIGGIEGSVHIPLGQLRDRAGEPVHRARPAVTYCAGGYRSSIAASLLRASGFADVSDLIGGY